MAKKKNKPSKKRLLLLLTVIIVGGYWIGPNWSNWQDQALHYIDNRDITTLEANFLPEQIIEAHRQELLSYDKRTLKNTTLKYYPYLLLNVKYTDQQKPREGFLLWGLNDGEMVINTDTWETTHGFRDCLECLATSNDFKILQALARHQGYLSIEDLQKELHIERELLSQWIEGAKQKHLIIQKSNILQLYFENPKLLITPQTKIKQQLVSKPIGQGQKIAKNYNQKNIAAITQAAFGKDFTIRNAQEVFLPVYSLEILNPDGSIQISEWNALTGKLLIPYYLNA